MSNKNLYDFFKKGGTTINKGLKYKTKYDFELNNEEQTYIVKENEVYDVGFIKCLIKIKI